MDHLFIMVKTSTLDLATAKVKEIAMMRTDDKGNQILAIVDPGSMDEFRDVTEGKFVIVSYFGYEFYKPLLDSHWGSENNILKGHTWVDLQQVAWPLTFDELLHDRSLEALGKYLGLVSPDKLWLLHQCYWTLMRRLTTGILFEKKVREKGGGFFESAQQLIRRF